MVPAASNVGNAMWLMPRTGWLAAPPGSASCACGWAVVEVTGRFLPVFCVAESVSVPSYCQLVSHKLDKLVIRSLACRHVPGTCGGHRRGPGGPVRRAAHQGAETARQRVRQRAVGARRDL